MPELKVAHFDDHDDVRAYTRDFLEFHNHQVVADAVDRRTSEQLIEFLRLGVVEANVAILDGDIKDISGDEIAPQIREMGGIAIIGLSGRDHGVAGVDINIPKGDGGAILQVLQGLPEPGTLEWGERFSAQRAGK
ncbi:MAG: hypothetical protein WD887_01165 [Candidatus Saccharimonadales bacterium]